MESNTTRGWTALSFTKKMTACVELFGYEPSDFEFYNQAYQIFDGLSEDRKQRVIQHYSN